MGYGHLSIDEREVILKMCAQQYYEKRRQASKEPYRLERDTWLRGYVQKNLQQYWSPEQISGRLNRDYDRDISPVTIYSWIYRNRSEGGVFYMYLRKTRRQGFGKTLPKPGIRA